MVRNEHDQIFELEIIVHYKAVYNFLLRLTSCESSADDLVQDTFVRAYQKLNTYTIGSNARAWLFAIARNLFINSYRKNKRRNEVEMDERTAYNQIDESNAMVAFEDLRKKGFLESELSDAVVKALSLLNEKQRSIVIMADLYDFSEKEVAKAMGINLNTVKSNTRRARIKMIKLLSEYGEQNYGLSNKRNLG